MFIDTTLKGTGHGRSFSIDMQWKPTGEKKPIILFVHGFKGFKDWGTFPSIARAFSERGYVFIKMNFSHNGVTVDQPKDFVDLEAFSNNTFTKELDDLNAAISFIQSNENPIPSEEIDVNNISVIGHSRGGSMAYIQASRDPRVCAVAGWAAVCDLENRWPDSMLIEWKEKGIYYLPNSRTGQLMPLKYDIVQDYLDNQQTLHIPTALKSLQIPALHIHGANDETVYLQEAKMVLKDVPHVDFEILNGANHVFGGSHPYESTELPDDTFQLIEKTDAFLRNNR